MDDEDIASRIDLSVVRFKRGCQEAADILEDALAMAPDDPTILYNLGFVLLRGGKAEKARDVLSGLVGQNPADAAARALLDEAIGKME